MNTNAQSATQCNVVSLFPAGPAPAPAGRPVPPTRKPNTESRSREYLLPDEVTAVMDAAKRTGRNGYRDYTAIMLCYRHGLRVSELVSLRWDMVDMKQANLHVTRSKHGTPAVHPLRGPELRALRQVLRESPASPYVFVSERGAPLSRRSVHAMVARAGKAAGIPFSVHPHMLRHATGYTLANAGQDTRAVQAYLGHRNIQHTVRYTQLDPSRFKGFFAD